MLAIAAEGDLVGAGLELARKVSVPFEAIVVQPPQLALFAVGDLLAVDVQPTLVEKTGELNMRGTGCLIGGQIHFRAIPKVTCVALAVGVTDTLRLRVEVRAEHFPLVGVVLPLVNGLLRFAGLLPRLKRGWPLGLAN